MTFTEINQTVKAIVCSTLASFFPCPLLSFVIAVMLNICSDFKFCIQGS